MLVTIVVVVAAAAALSANGTAAELSIYRCNSSTLRILLHLLP
jgi:hypothetical protein